MQETKLNLTKDQLQTVINDHIIKENGVNELFSTFVNALMYCERKQYLENNDQIKNKANGFRKILKAGINSGLHLAIPRDRLSLFKPMILGILKEQEEQIKELSFELYGKGLTTREISQILERIYGKNYSKSTISNISLSYYDYIKSWSERKLLSYYPLIMIDALYLKVRRDTVESEAFYVVLGLKPDFTREILSIKNIPTESSKGWKAILLDLQERGIKKVNLFVTDDLKGLDETISSIYPKSNHQKCILHLQKNITKEIRIKERKIFCEGLKEVFYPEKDKKIEEKVREIKNYLSIWESKYPSLKRIKEKKDLENYFTYYKYKREIRRMIYTTNWIERFNKSVKRTTKIRNSFPNPESALFLIGYKGMEMEEGAYKYPIYEFRNEDKFKQI